MSNKIEKKWYQSKTKWAALLIGIGPVLATVGGIVGGTVELTSGIVSLSAQLGVVLGVFGIRDLPFINKNK